MLNETKNKRLNLHVNETPKKNTKWTLKDKYNCYGFSYTTFKLVKLELKFYNLLRALKKLRKFQNKNKLLE